MYVHMYVIDLLDISRQLACTMMLGRRGNTISLYSSNCWVHTSWLLGYPVHKCHFQLQYPDSYIVLLVQVDLMDHPLYTIAYVADVENVLVVMINRVPPPSAGDSADKRVNVENDEQSEANEAMKKEEEEKEKEEELTEGEEEAVRTQEDEGGGGEGEGGGKGGKEIEGGREAENKEEAKEDSGDSVEKTGSQVTAEEEEGSGEGEMTGLNIGPIPRMTCHVLETNDVSSSVQWQPY